MPLAPIALFVYRRLEHTRKTVEALQNNKLAQESDLIVFSDAPKNEAARTDVEAVRQYLKTINGFKSLRLVNREKNLGLSRSIISGVTEVLEQYGKIIVLEDDLITSPYFLIYLNDGLDLYENEEKVISLHAYTYPVKTKMPETFFLKGADCWGWATWRRGWQLFEADGRKLLEELQAKKLNRAFDLDNSYPYTLMLKSQIKGFNDSWAIRWHASAFLKNRLTLYPGTSLVRNAGFDGMGTNTHNRWGDIFQGKISQEPIKLERIPAEENEFARRAVIKYFRSPRLYLTSCFSRLKYYFRALKKIYAH